MRMKKGTIKPEVRAVMEMYEESGRLVRLEDESSEWSQVKVGVHQDSLLSPLFVEIVMHALTDDEIKTTKEFLYADRLVLVEDNWKEAEEKFSKWKKALESKGLKVNDYKTKATKIGTKLQKEAANQAIDSCKICRRQR